MKIRMLTSAVAVLLINLPVNAAPKTFQLEADASPSFALNLDISLTTPQLDMDAAVKQHVKTTLTKAPATTSKRTLLAWQPSSQQQNSGE